jgi:hypothetical protein
MKERGMSFSVEDDDGEIYVLERWNFGEVD